MTPETLAWATEVAERDRRGVEINGHIGRWRIADTHIPLGFDGRPLSYCPRCHRGEISSPCIIARMRAASRALTFYTSLGLIPARADVWVFSCELDAVPAATARNETAVEYYLRQARNKTKEGVDCRRVSERRGEGRYAVTAEELRKDADRREALARAATPGPWRYGGRRIVTGTASVGESVFVCDVLEDDTPDAAHITANDPPAVIASCGRDRLLAGAADLLDDAESATEWDGGGKRWFAKVVAWRARFAALGGSDA